MAFGVEAEDTYGNTAQGFGMIGKSGSGKVRIAPEIKALLPKAKRYALTELEPPLTGNTLF